MYIYICIYIHTYACVFWLTTDNTHLLRSCRSCWATCTELSAKSCAISPWHNWNSSMPWFKFTTSHRHMPHVQKWCMHRSTCNNYIACIFCLYMHMHHHKNTYSYIYIYTYIFIYLFMRTLYRYLLSSLPPKKNTGTAPGRPHHDPLAPSWSAAAGNAVGKWNLGATWPISKPYTYTYVHTYVYIYISICRSVDLSVYLSIIHACMYVPICIYMYIYFHT